MAGSLGSLGSLLGNLFKHVPEEAGSAAAKGASERSVAGSIAGSSEHRFGAALADAGHDTAPLPSITGNLHNLSPGRETPMLPWLNMNKALPDKPLPPTPILKQPKPFVPPPRQSPPPRPANPTPQEHPPFPPSSR